MVDNFVGVREDFEVWISECNANPEYKFNCVIDKIEEVSHNVDVYKANIDSKVS